MSDTMAGEFVLYHTGKGLVHISNGVRVRILDELSKRNLSLTEMVEITGKAQSTLSVHLDSMVKEGVITSREDPDDNRRKTYSISSVRLAETKSPDSESLAKSKEIFADMADEPESISNYMVSFLYVAMDSVGLSLGPMSKIMGSVHAQAIGGRFQKGPIEEVIDDIRKYYSFANMGKVTVFSFNPLTLIIDSELNVSKGAAETMGMYAVGYFAKALEMVYGMSFTVVSSEVFGPENNYFRFVLDNKAP